MSNTSVFCIAKNQGQAERIIQRLIGASFSQSDISVLVADTGSLHDIGHVKATKAPEGTATGAATGGVAGGVLGLLAGIGSLAIPGVGALIAAGPIMAALSGAAVGAAAGGIVGGLIGLGIPELEAKIYDGKLKNGNYLISVHAHDREHVHRVKEVFQSENAEDICSTGEESVPERSEIIKPSGSMEENSATHSGSASR